MAAPHAGWRVGRAPRAAVRSIWSAACRARRASALRRLAAARRRGRRRSP